MASYLRRASAVLILIPTILCGGSGSRLWPVSRELHPKPFMRLADGQSLLQKAFLRGAKLPDVAKTIVVGSRDLFFRIEDELAAVNQAAVQLSFILEPMGRNTAAAVAAATLQALADHGSQAVLLVLAADHLISDQEAFADAVAQAARLAGEGRIVTFGIQPTGPETGYGYIEADGNKVVRFVEKPSAEVARGYVDSGRFVWNSGMFCFRADTMLEELSRLCPDIVEATQACLAVSRRASGERLSEIELDAKLFAQVRDDSIDYAVMEKSARVAVVPCSIGWSDIGSWTAVGDLASADADGNRVDGVAFFHNAKNTYVHSASRMVSVVGVDNLLIVDTADAVLVADRNRAQDVKQVYSQLKALGHEAYKLHTTVHRPWGTYTVLEEGVGFKVKRIEVKPGASLSLQMHHHRSEHWTVVQGEAVVVNGDQVLELKTNQSTYIQAGSKHRLENRGASDVVMIEVQTGSYLGEDDIVRFEDKYGRVPSVESRT